MNISALFLPANLYPLCRLLSKFPGWLPFAELCGTAELSTVDCLADPWYPLDNVPEIVATLAASSVSWQ